MLSSSSSSSSSRSTRSGTHQSEASTASTASSFIGMNRSRTVILLIITVIMLLLWDDNKPFLAGGPHSFLSWSGLRSRKSIHHYGDIPVYDGYKLYDATYLYTEEAMEFDSWKHFPPEALAPLTGKTQEYLYKHQHPISCDNQRYLISKGSDYDAGLGSHVHTSGMHFALAIEFDRIFLWAHDVAQLYTDEETCGTNKQNLECFFRAPSNCTLIDAYKDGSNTIEVRYAEAATDHKVKITITPTVFQHMWKETLLPISVHEMKYWWRAQSVAYLMRFRKESIALLRRLRTEPEKIIVYPDDEKKERSQLMKKAFPLPQGTVNLHVRHGDKGNEMHLVLDKKYYDEAESLVLHAPFSYHRAAFVSTEDPSTIEYAKSIDNRPNINHGWQYIWYDVPRINSNGADQLEKISTIKRGVLTHIWWLQLFMSLECDAWIGTRASNWNRLIDELRCIWVPKCYNEFVEVGLLEEAIDYHW
jgi:hypothetical protein